MEDGHEPRQLPQVLQQLPNGGAGGAAAAAAPHDAGPGIELVQQPRQEVPHAALKKLPA